MNYSIGKKVKVLSLNQNGFIGEIVNSIYIIELDNGEIISTGINNLRAMRKIKC